MNVKFTEKHLLVILCLVAILYVCITSIDNVGITILLIPISFIIFDSIFGKQQNTETSRKENITQEYNIEKEDINSEKNIYIIEEDAEKGDVSNSKMKSIFQSKALLSLLKIISLIVIALLCLMFFKSSNSVTF